VEAGATTRDASEVLVDRYYDPVQMHIADYALVDEVDQAVLLCASVRRPVRKAA
jgi:N-acetylglutamate synthase-like GNAT family acetyltransferase